MYGISGIIHVHHLAPLHESTGVREVDPEKDLIPVCPNCHAAIHAKRNEFNKPDVYSPNEIRRRLGFPPLETY